MRSHADDLRGEVANVETADELVDQLAADWRAVSRAQLEKISRRAAALCAHTEKLTRAPASITASDVDTLRAAGCTDEAVHDLTQVVGFFNHYNRLADGLGIDPEPDWA